MLNTTIMYLHLMSMTSMSPFYTIRNQYNEVIRTSLIHCHFSNFFMSTLLTYSTHQETMIRNSVFSHSLSTALRFNSVYDCGISSDKTNPLTMPIENKIITPSNFSAKQGEKEWDNQRAYFLSECGNISIHFCSFVDCFSQTEPGGSIWINQECFAVIHGTTFSGSHTKSNRGGACCIAKKVNADTDEPNDERIASLNIQYCCFSDCYTDEEKNKLYGLALFIAAEDAVFYFSSTINCPPKDKLYKPKGAQVDIQAENVKSKNINITGGRSIYCAGIEYRYATMGHFMFQTIRNIEECMFATSLTKVNISGLTLSFSNYDNNRLVNNAEGKDFHLVPGLIHVRFDEIKIDNFCFTNFIDNSNLSNSKIVSRGTYYTKDGNVEINHEQKVMITLSNCYRDNTISEDQIGVKYVDGQQMLFADVKVNENLKTNDIPHLFLGHCEGAVAPDDEIKIEDVDEPSPSLAFTESNDFSQSKNFDPTNKFSQSDKFSVSSAFTDSNKFTQSKDFIETDKFTKSNYFSESNDFTKSDNFKATKEFTKSDNFKATKEFTKSDNFKATKEFTKSDNFKATKEFTKSDNFKATKEFTKSDNFKATKEFTKSDYFGATKEFTKSNYFSSSKQFTSSSDFKATQKFTKSFPFTHSNSFSNSFVFTSSESFTPRDNVIVSIKEGETNQKNTNLIKIGIGVAVAAVAVIAAIAAFFLLKRKRLTSDLFDDETIDLTEDNTSSIVTKNPLLNLMNDDDPFNDEFN